LVYEDWFDRLIAGITDGMDLKQYRIFEVFQKERPLFWTVVGIALVGLIGLFDYLTGNEITLSLFYLLPIVLVTLAVNQNAGMFISFLSALTLQAAEIAAGQVYSSILIYILNTLIRALFYFFVVYLVAALHKSQTEERLAARTDFVTGAINARFFSELLQMEIDRIRRYPHPITVVYIDVDNFKLVNDLFGHQIGDEMLRYIAGELKSQLRKTDIVARVGGDEFILMLPSTRQQEAELVLAKIRSSLQEAMNRRNWPVTFSMGVVTCVAPPFSSQQLIQMADELMYEVKNTVKNDVRFATWGNGIARRH
jgi:diguanylate cyclase (GGDEF)-like protein